MFTIFGENSDKMMPTECCRFSDTMTEKNVYVYALLPVQSQGNLMLQNKPALKAYIFQHGINGLCS